jgi:hypothetical protein
MHYAVENFNADVYALDHESNDAFVTIGNWSESYSACSAESFSRCRLAQYNTADNVFPQDRPPHAMDAPPVVVKIAAYFKPMGDDGLPDPFMIQHLAAFMMAVREINNKTDGVSDDLLPNTEIVFTLKSPSGLIGAEVAVDETMNYDFAHTGKLSHRHALCF